MGALKDCEAVVHTVLGQPVNSLTTIAFLVAAVIVWSRTSRRWVAVALVATGVGSFLFHGPMPSTAQLVHDVTLWLLVGAVVVSIAVDYRRARALRHLLGPVLLLGGAAIVGRLGSTGGPLCDPDSIWQPHGLWHVASAAAVVWWAIGSERRAVSG
jgi:hypothetical protein